MIYYFPNRPFLVSQTDTVIDEKSASDDWIAEPKFNGDRLVLFYENGKFQFWNRHKSMFRKFTPLQSMIDELNSLNLPDKCQLDGELLHFKTKTTKNTIVFYDIYQYDGVKVNSPYEVRKELISNHLDGNFKHLKLVPVFTKNFREIFNDFVKKDDQLYEGLVMKNLKGELVFNSVSSPDVSWQLKIRRPSKNYKF